MSKKKKVQVQKATDAVFVYTSKCCEAPARKPPVQRSADDRKENKFSECTLGKWHCTNCGKSAKVSRSKPVKESGNVGTAETDKPE